MSISGAALPMVFISLSGLAMGTLKQEQINAASGIYNFVRNIGGSIGIAAANTIAQRHLQTHRNQMVHWFSGASLALHRQMHMLENLMKLHAGPAKAMLRAAALLQTGLNNQAQLWAYVDVFRYLAIVCAVAVPIAFVMKKAASKAAAA